MPDLNIKVRYSRELSDPELPCHEEHFTHGWMQWTIPAEQAGIVLVDCWDQHPVETHLERGGQIAHDKILPAVEACRKAGITVVHAPSPQTARRYPQWKAYAGDEELFDPVVPGPDWPTPQMRNRQEEYQAFTRPIEPRREQWLRDVLPQRKIMDLLGPEPEDFVIATGDQLHRLCRDRGLFHLFYAGFAANICVQRRDYGVWPMMDRGYNVILLRDCTTAIEMASTWEGMWLTHAAVLNIELRGASITSDEFIAACRGE